MIDAILYVSDFPLLVSYLDTHYPEMLVRDEGNAILMPPVVTGFSRTPAQEATPEVMVYARLTGEQAAQWRGMPGVEVLAEAPFAGKGTGDVVYSQVFDDPNKYAIYSRVYPHAPYEVVDQISGEAYTVVPSKKFGVIAGA